MNTGLGFFKAIGSRAGYAARGRFSRRRCYHAAIAELYPLEPRMLLSVVVQPGGRSAIYTDVDGDQVTITVSKGTLMNDNFISQPTGDGDQLQEIDLSMGGFTGANISMSVVKEAGGDGLANIGYINASGQDLGSVTVLGDLGRIDAGDGKATAPAIHSLTVESMGTQGLATQPEGGDLNSNIFGAVGSLTVKEDIQNALIYVQGTGNATLGPVNITRSLVGGDADNSGQIYVVGNIASVHVGQDVQGGGGNSSGSITSEDGSIGPVTIGGSLLGGSGDESAHISAGTSLGQVKITGNLTGGGGLDSAAISAQGGNLAGITVGGTITGGSGNSSAQISAFGNMGAVSIAHDLIGGEGSDSAEIGAGTVSGNIVSVTIGGSLEGGTGDLSGRITTGGNFGPIQIMGDMVGNQGEASGGISTVNGGATSVTVEGSVIGGTGLLSAQIESQAALGPVKIGGYVLGANGSQSAEIESFASTIASITIAGSLTGGAGDYSGRIFSEGNLGPITIGLAGAGSSVTGGSGTESAEITSHGGKIVSVTIGGDLAGGTGDLSGRINSFGNLGPVKITGDLHGNSGDNSGSIGTGTGSSTAGAGVITRVTIGGDMLGGGGDLSAQIDANSNLGKISIGGNVEGGSGNESGEILSITGNITGVTIGGGVVGASGGSSAEIICAGTLGPVKIDGSVTGGDGADSAEIASTGNSIASITILGGLIGGGGDFSASIEAGGLGPVNISGITGGTGSSSGSILCLNGAIASVKLDGDLRGGAGDNSGLLDAGKNIGSITITGGVLGMNGSQSGMIFAGGKVASISVGGSVEGGDGDSSGVIQAHGTIASLTIDNDIDGGGGFESGLVFSNAGAISKAMIGGSIVGGPGENTGFLFADTSLPMVSVAGSLTCGASGEGGIEAGSIGKVVITHDVDGASITAISGGISSVTVDGSVYSDANATSSAAIQAATILGSLVVRGDITGLENGTVSTPVVISATGDALKGRTDSAINTVTVLGNLAFTNILAGYSPNDDLPVDPHAQMGTISVSGNWTAANIIAGAQNTPSGNTNFGDGNDTAIPPATVGTNTAISTIAAIKIGGTLTGTDSGANAVDHFGFVARQITALTINGAKITLTAGPSNDNVALGTTGDFTLDEIA